MSPYNLYDVYALDLAILTNPDALDRKIEWKLASPAYVTKTRLFGQQDYIETMRSEHPMQRQFNIELRVDFADPEKNEAIKKIATLAARHLYTNASLLADGIKPMIAVYSDDWFAGHEQVKLLDDLIADGKQMTGTDDEVASAEDAIAADLVKAMSNPNG